MGEDGPENLRTVNAIRVEKTRHSAYSRDRSNDAIEPYLSQMNTYKARTRPLDQTRLLQDPNVQDWAALTGARRSLATNITDAGPHINVNKIRYKRDADYVSTTPYDGGPTYNDEVCINNFVEERRDKTFKSGFHPRELQRGGSRYSTEYGARFKPSSSEYAARLQSTYNATQRFQGLDRIGTTGIAAPLRTVNATEAHYDMSYARDGFGGSTHQDHTSGGRRGNFWVGTAPPKHHDSITHSTLRREPLEFQKRCPWEDPRSQVLEGSVPLIHESDGTRRVRDALLATNTIERTWKTMYQTEHKDYSRRPATVA